jgi:hypothetical protein
LGQQRTWQETKFQPSRHLFHWKIQADFIVCVFGTAATILT